MDISVKTEISAKDPMLKGELYRESVNRAYMNYKNMLISEAYNLLEDYSLAEDCVQDAFTALWYRLTNSQEEIESELGYLLSVVRKSSFKNFNRSIKETATDDSELDIKTDGTFEETISVVEDKEYIKKLLSPLPIRSRMAIIFHCGYGLTCRATAEQLGGSEESIKKLIGRSVESLRRECS